MSPTLFLCYVNDLQQHLLYSEPSMFADDTALTVHGDSILDISNKLNLELENINMYFAHNKLKINASKTKCMLFHSSRKYTQNNELLLTLGSTEIEQVTDYKYLGVIMDPLLNFKSHVEYISRKVKQRTSILWRMRNFVSQDLAKQLYITMINPVFTYCNYVYDGCGVTSSRDLEILQNNALRAVRKVDYRYSATSLHNELYVDWLDVGRKISTCVEAFKLSQGKGPLSLTELFKEKPPVRPLRSNALKLPAQPRTRTKLADNDFAIRSKTYWKYVPPEIRDSKTAKNFKKRLKEAHIFEHVR